MKRRQRRPAAVTRGVASQIATTTTAVRSAMGLGQRTVAVRASVPQSSVSAVEAGEAGRLALDTSLRILEALGVEVRVQLDGPVVRGRSRRMDAVHAWTAGRVGERLRRGGWEVVDEAEVGSGRIRGYIDLLRTASPTGPSSIEVKIEIRDSVLSSARCAGTPRGAGGRPLLVGGPAAAVALVAGLMGGGGGVARNGGCHSTRVSVGS
jgi:transcriptional regulator with XRE-family HTH domain